MAISLKNAEVVVLSQIVHNVKQVVELRMLTPFEGAPSLEVLRTLIFVDREKRQVVQTAPLPPIVYDGAELKALMADGYERAKDWEKQGAAVDQCLYAGIRDAIYAALERDQAWAPVGVTAT